MKNFFLCKSFEGVNSCGSTVLAGQHNLSDAEYSDVAEQHLSDVVEQYLRGVRSPSPLAFTPGKKVAPERFFAAFLFPFVIFDRIKHDLIQKFKYLANIPIEREPKNCRV